MKNIINITIIILCTCIFYGCKKKDKPHGANIVRYKLNGVEKKIEGNYSSFSLEGILKNFSTNQRSFTAYSNDGGQPILDPYIGIGNFPTIGEKGTFSLGGNTNINTKGIYLSFKFSNSGGGYNQYFYRNYENSGSFTLTDNSSDFISGTFNAVLLKDTIGVIGTDTIGPETISITDGYFDVPINKQFNFIKMKKIIFLIALLCQIINSNAQDSTALNTYTDIQDSLLIHLDKSKPAL